MHLRFGSWNVNGRILQPNHVSLLREHQLDLLALQEATQVFHDALSRTNLYKWSVSSLSLRPPAATDGKARRLGCSLFASSSTRLGRAFVLSDAPFPERTLVALLHSSNGDLTACSFHAPPGASWGSLKPASLKLIAQWLAPQRTRVVFGIDANAPKTDHPDIARNEWWWPDEPLLLGASPLHSLKDALRVYLDANPDEAQMTYARRPNGPLACSHVRGNSYKKTECRYDFVYVTPDIRVIRVAYLYEAAVAAGSDHALVVADLDVG